MSNSKEWREANKEKIREYAKRYYKTHKQKILEYNRRYHEAHKDEIRVKYAHHRKHWDEAHRPYIYEHARLSAEIRNAGTDFNAASPAIIKKDYLRELHAKGMV